MSKKKEKAADIEENIPETPPAESETTEAEQTVAKTEYAALNDRYLRTAAEHDTLRKRSQRERDSIHADAVAYAVTSILPVYDNLERALKQETEDAEFKKGVEMTASGLLESLKKLGVQPIESAPGTVFD